MSISRSLSFAAVVTAVLGCTSEDPPGGSGGFGPDCEVDGDCAASPATPICDAEAGACAGLPLGHQIGWRDGAASSVVITPVYEAGGREATDLEFHPTRNELWVALREYPTTSPCTSANPSGCEPLAGRVLIITNPGQEGETEQVTMDPNAYHFMRRPPALAMGAGDTWGTCGEFRTGNLDNDPLDYIGPTLFSSDPAIWTIQPVGKNGSHLDMLHETPLCMGIAWERDNVYWVFNGQNGAIDRYDFNQPHEIGGEDHSDGTLTRYVLGQLLRTPNVPSHMAFGPDGQLYIADTGHGRIVKLDPASGAINGMPSPINEPLASADQIDGATLTDVVPPGTVVAPSGLHIKDGILFVTTDNATSTIHAFGLDGALVNTLATEFAPGTLAGLTIGPDDKVYFVDKLSSNVHRIDPK